MTDDPLGWLDEDALLRPPPELPAVPSQGIGRRARRKKAEEAKALDRKEKIVELTKQGASLAQIGAALGVGTQRAFVLRKETFSSLHDEVEGNFRAYRAHASEQIEAAEVAAWEAAFQRGDNGELVLVDGHALDRFLKLQESRRRLWGLDLKVDPTTLAAQNMQVIVNSLPPWEEVGGAEAGPDTGEGAAGDGSGV